MKFADIRILMYLAPLVPILFFFYIWALRREKIALERFAEKDLLPGIAPTYGKDPKRVRVFLNIAAVLLMIIAFARPQWGFYWKEEQSQGVDVVIAIDTSKSMLVRDMRPDRLAYSKNEVMDFVKKLKGDRVGLIAFAGQAFLQCPLTVDYSGFLIALNDLNTDTIPRGGTSLPSAIEEAVRSYKGAHTADRVLIIITDGENTEGDIKKAIQEAKKEKVMISCVGIGSAKGETIPVVDEKGNKTYLKDKNGQLVKSSLDENILKTLAENTGGIYVRATATDFGLNKIYEKRLSTLEKGKTQDRKVKVFKERFQYPIALVLLCLMLEMVLRRRNDF
ncbi:MAG: VWA domain-containing protein [Candidatus Tantalella remota]|nr:VWA domain-containing protein [Candidatus Tantalella remota]